MRRLTAREIAEWNLANREAKDEMEDMRAEIVRLHARVTQLSKMREPLRDAYTMLVAVTESPFWATPPNLQADLRELTGRMLIALETEQEA